MQFKIPPDGPSDGSMPGSGGLGSPRTQGAAAHGTVYRNGDGPKGSGGDSKNAGPNGTVNGPGGSHIKGFMGKPKGYEHKAVPDVRGMTNAMKR